MRLYVTGRTNLPGLTLDYIELALPDGGTVSLNWDESESGVTDGTFDARYKGVLYGEEYGNGRIRELEGARFDSLGYYTEDTGTENPWLEVTGFEIIDNDEQGRESSWELPELPLRINLDGQDFTG